MPEWAKTLQYRAPDGHRYYVGVFSDASTREEALERSWLNTLISIARVEFPFLQTIKQFSVETLSGSEYRREAALAIERVRFDGVAEAQEKGSPHIVAKVVNGKEVFTAYRLLKWQEAKISSEVTRLKAEEKAPQLPNTTYENQIGDAGKATGQLTIQTKPAGAQILLDGDPLGRSNASFPKVSEGVYKLILQRDGYETVEKQITIYPAKVHSEAITLKKLQGIARITSSPSGALVFVDNVPVGRTPTEVKREFGSGNIRVELGDYFSESKEMSFNHIPVDQGFDLRPKDGKISILSTPNGATVSVDGRIVGKTPWLGQIISGGQHQVTLSLDQFEDWSEIVEIRASKSISLAPKLQPVQSKRKDGKISILSTPNGATVSIDGRIMGKTPWLGQIISDGQHRVTLSLDQFEDWSEIVEIRESESISLAPKLQPAQSKRISSQDLSIKRENPFGKMAPVGKWVAGGTSVFFWLLAQSAESSADEAYSKYRRATNASDAKAARNDASSYDSSASTRKTFSVVSGLISLAFIALDWKSGSAKSEESVGLEDRIFQILFEPSIGTEGFQKFALSLRVDYGGK